MNKLYFMCDSPYQKIANAVATDKTLLADDMIEELENLDEIPFNFTLKNMVFRKNGFIYNDDFSKYENVWGDCQINSYAWVMVSPRLRDVIEKNLKGGECFRWIKCNIVHKEEKRIYYTPFFTKMLDVLDMDKCDYANRKPSLENLIKPVFSAEKIKNLSMFSCPESIDLWKMPTGFYVTDDMRKAIKKAGFKGIDFEQAALVE